ncbi:hypothetical protein CJJ09_000061 [Candidozyma auris]|nr:hypothetical protein CJJ09_000061 [[Candida] auris]
MDGLDATQVYGQAKMVLSGVGESLLYEKLPELRKKYGARGPEPAGSEPEASESEEEGEEEEKEKNEDGATKASDSEDDAPSEFEGVESDHSDSDSDTKVGNEEEPAKIEKDAFGLNDEFFDIDDFNKQIVELEDDPSDNDEQIDYFGDLSDEDDSEAEMDYYDGFFDKPGRKRSKEKAVASQEDSDNVSELEDEEYEDAVDGAMLDLFADEDEHEKKPKENQSSFEKQQEKLRAEIANLEAELKKTEVSEEKSSKSLAEIYEDEYHGVDPDQKISEEVQQAHNEITDLFTKLNYKLDSLCSAHYIPKPHEFKTIDIKVTDGAASINMEDAQPLHVSEETTLAPQEVYKIGDDKPQANGADGVKEVQLKSGLSYSKDELSTEDKQRLRRAKKRAKSKHMKEINEAREQRKKQMSDGGDKKRQKVGDALGDLAKAKNVTVIDKKGQMRDASGQLKKQKGPQSGSDFRL